MDRLYDLFWNMKPTSRREFLKRSAIMGATVPAVGSLLAACGGDDDDDDTTDGEGATDGDSESTPADRPGSVPTPAGDTGQQEEEATEPAEATAEATEPAEATAEATEAEEATAEATEAADEGAAGEPQQGGTMVVMGHEAVDGLSPDFIGPTVNWSVITQIHDALAEMDPWFEYQPALAESWEINEDGTQYSYQLREGVVFHDGEDFTAEDVKYTMEYYANPDNAMVTGSDFRTIESVEAQDDLTAVITLSTPNAAFITQAGSAFIVAQHHHSELGDDGYSSDPIGTGPFRLREYVAQEFVEVEAFEDHWAGRPHLDAFRLNVVPEPSVRAVALETNEADSSV